MRVEDFKVTWEYDDTPLGRITSCYIRSGDTVIAEGATLCSSKDQFVKETGRKISLARALRFVAFSKEIRTKFWNAYFSRKIA